MENKRICFDSNQGKAFLYATYRQLDVGVGGSKGMATSQGVVLVVNTAEHRNELLLARDRLSPIFDELQ